MATAAFKTFIKYPHGKTEIVDGINYEVAKLIICPKCWMKYIYIYLDFIFTIIAAWFALESRDIGASIATIVFVFVFNSISEIVVPRILPGTKQCQDIPFPPQSGEVIKLVPFLHLAFKYTSEESQARFLKAVTRENEETECEIETENNMPRLKTSEDKQDSECGKFRQDWSKNNLLLLGEGEVLCRGQEFVKKRAFEANLLNRSFFEVEFEVGVFHQPLFESGVLHRHMSEGELEAGVLRRSAKKSHLLRRTMSEGEVCLLRRSSFEGC